ncbi:hypothetical protein [Halorubrum cibi]
MLGRGYTRMGASVWKCEDRGHTVHRADASHRYVS